LAVAGDTVDLEPDAVRLLEQDRSAMPGVDRVAYYREIAG
jgi:hypothetical protein